MAEIQFTDEQRRIITHSGAQIVVAGAGTGKTETLTHHIIHLLLDKKYALHEIVAITFTEKAAAEMRERVYDALRTKVLLAQGEERRRLERLRNNFSAQNRITTIDGFNAALLAEYPEFSPLPADYQIVDEYTLRSLHTESRRLLLNELRQDETRGQLFAELHDVLEQWDIFDKLETLAELSDEDLQKMQRDINRDDFIEQITHLALPILGEAWRDYVTAIPPQIDGDIKNRLCDAEAILDAKLLTTKGQLSKTTMKKDEALAAVEGNWPDEAAECYKKWYELQKKWCEDGVFKRDLLEHDWQLWNIQRKLANLAQVYRRLLHQHIRQTGKVRFSDVAEAVLQMLRDHSAVREEIQRGIKHILLDEFQDTNAAQWELVNLLRGADNVMLVGDPKQSIYRFRGGDVTLFESIRRQEFVAENRLELTVSQRSCPSLIHFFNDLFAHVFIANEKRPIYEAAHQALHIPSRNQDVTSGGVTWIDNEMEDDDSNRKPDEARALAVFLRCLQDDADIIAKQDAGKVLFMPQYQHIAEAIARGESGVIGVLSPSHDHKSACERMLREYGVQFTSYHSRGFYSSMPVLLAINLARFFYNNADSMALAGLLRSPLCGFSDRMLITLSAQNPHLWEAINSDEVRAAIILTEEEQELLHAAHEYLQHWQQLSRVLPFSDVLQYVWDESWLPFYFSLERDGGQQQENYAKLVDTLRDAQQNSEYGLAEIASYLEALRDEETNTESQADVPDSGSIQLMTLHASKGLGFPMTILTRTSRQARAKREKVRSIISDDTGQKYFSLSFGQKSNALLWEVAGIADKAQSLAEVKRELYVACTRAKQHFVVIPSGSGEWQKWLDTVRTKHARYEYEMERLEEKYHSAPRTKRVTSQNRDQESEIPLAISNTQIEAPLDGSILPIELSVSQLLSEVFPSLQNAEEMIVADKDETLPDEILHQEIAYDAKSRGSLIHRMLEWENKSTFTALKNLMKQEGLPLSDAKSMENLAYLAQRELEKLPLIHERALHETPFTLNHFELQKYFYGRAMSPALGGWLKERNKTHWCNGIIDYMAPLIDGGYAILDFKTHWNAAVRDSDLTTERVKMQLQIYAIAARNMGLDVRKLYALRLYGVEGDVELESFNVAVS